MFRNRLADDQGSEVCVCVFARREMGFIATIHYTFFIFCFLNTFFRASREIVVIRNKCSSMARVIVTFARNEKKNLYNRSGYRDGNNLRKMKSHLGPGLPSSTMYHKQMRHATGFQSPHSRDSRSSAPPPPPPLESASHMQHQSTPLARLSPSSELSQQLPRILTLRVSAHLRDFSA